MIYTIGHSTRSLDELIDLLKLYNVKMLIDVRRFPSSKKYPHFNQENLIKTLGELSINYFWLGELLGGFRKEGYEKYTETEDFKKGIEELLKISKQRETVIMCAEIVWFRCHRRYISDKLVQFGYDVVHIIDGKRTYVHKLKKT